MTKRLNPDLATQIEQAGPEQQQEMLGKAFDAIFSIDWASADKVQEQFCATFEALLAIGTDEAFTGAALMLVPDGQQCEIILLRDGRGACRMWALVEHPSQWAPNCATPALAIAAACVRAHDKENE